MARFFAARPVAAVCDRRTALVERRYNRSAIETFRRSVLLRRLLELAVVHRNVILDLAELDDGVTVRTQPAYGEGQLYAVHILVILENRLLRGLSFVGDLDGQIVAHQQAALGVEVKLLRAAVRQSGVDHVRLAASDLRP